MIEEVKILTCLKVNLKFCVFFLFMFFLANSVCVYLFLVNCLCPCVSCIVISNVLATHLHPSASSTSSGLLLVRSLTQYPHFWGSPLFCNSKYRMKTLTTYVTKYIESILWRHWSKCLNNYLNRDISMWLYMVFELVLWLTVLITINAEFRMLFITTVSVLLLENAFSHVNVAVLQFSFIWHLF